MSDDAVTIGDTTFDRVDHDHDVTAPQSVDMQRDQLTLGLA